MNYTHIILFYLTRVTCQVFLAYHTEHCNWWPVRSWKKATVNILEHQSTRSWWILSARVCIVDCTCPKAHKFNWLSKAETLDLKPWQTEEHVKCVESDHIHSLGWMFEVFLFVGKNFTLNFPLHPEGLIRISRLPSNIWLASNFSLQYHL